MSIQQTQSILDEALRRPLEIETGSFRNAQHLRKLLYNLRGRHRREGRTLYDDLFMSIVDGSSILTIRDGLPYDISIKQEAPDASAD